MSKTEIVVDTNVAVVANGKAKQASPQCVHACIAGLRHVRDECRLLVDDKYLVFDEYQAHLSRAGQPGPGDAFFKWLWFNQANTECCRMITVTAYVDDDCRFDEFPDDPSLSKFDRSDRKFVAIALASATEPKVLNACDTDWWRHRKVLGKTWRSNCLHLSRTNANVTGRRIDYCSHSARMNRISFRPKKIVRHLCKLARSVHR